MDDVDAFIQRTGISSLGDMQAKLPEVLCHIGQEPEVFGTRSSDNVRTREYTDKVLRTPATAYLRYLARGKGLDKALVRDGRAAAICTNFADVAARVASRVVDKEVYIAGCVNPVYAQGHDPKRYFIHYLNAYIKGERMRFFDMSIYKHIFDPVLNKWVPKNGQWDSLDIPQELILWKNGLQTDDTGIGQRRTIGLRPFGNQLVIFDNQAEHGLVPHFYQRVAHRNETYIYVEKDKEALERLVLEGTP